MFTDTFDFEAHSWKKGHFWTRAEDLQCVKFYGREPLLLTDPRLSEDPHTQFLVRCGGEGEDDWNVVKPDENHSLYLDFSSIAPGDKDGIRAFADNYGFLGNTELLLCKSPGRIATRSGRGPRNGCNTIIPRRENGELVLHKLGEDVFDVDFERLDYWSSAITSLRQAVNVYQHLRQGNEKDLELLLEWQEPRRGDNGSWGFASDNSPGWGTVLDSNLTKNSKAVTVAWAWLDQTIEEHIASWSGVRFGLDREIGRRVLRYVPSSLRSLMWFQFARAVAGEAPIRACKVCTREFQLEPGDKQRKVFCGLPCKQKDYRDRKSKAKEMRSKGTGMKEIAATLDTDLETIKDWVSEIQIPKKRR